MKSGGGTGLSLTKGLDGRLLDDLEEVCAVRGRYAEAVILVYAVDCFRARAGKLDRYIFIRAHKNNPVTLSQDDTLVTTPVDLLAPQFSGVLSAELSGEICVAHNHFP